MRGGDVFGLRGIFDQVEQHVLLTRVLEVVEQLLPRDRRCARGLKDGSPARSASTAPGGWHIRHRRRPDRRCCRRAPLPLPVPNHEVLTSMLSSALPGGIGALRMPATVAGMSIRLMRSSHTVGLPAGALAACSVIPGASKRAVSNVTVETVFMWGSKGSYLHSQSHPDRADSTTRAWCWPEYGCGGRRSGTLGTGLCPLLHARRLAARRESVRAGRSRRVMAAVSGRRSRWLSGAMASAARPSTTTVPDTFCGRCTPEPRVAVRRAPWVSGPAPSPTLKGLHNRPVPQRMAEIWLAERCHPNAGPLPHFSAIHLFADSPLRVSPFCSWATPCQRGKKRNYRLGARRVFAVPVRATSAACASSKGSRKLDVLQLGRPSISCPPIGWFRASILDRAVARFGCGPAAPRGSCLLLRRCV